ncbi:MAG: HD domain-containing phosphohydrolase [Planctomycetota bacterium]
MSTTPQKSPPSTATRPRHDFHEIHVNTLRVNSILPFQLFTRIEGEFIVYRRENLPFTQNQRVALIDNDVQVLYVLPEEIDFYWLYLNDSIHKLIDTEDDPLENRASVFYRSTFELSKRIYDVPLGHENVDKVQDLVTTSVEYLDQKQRLHELMPAMEQHPTVYSHSLNVSQFGLALAREIGISSKAELEAIGMGLLLQDYGMLQIPESLLFKEGPLSFDEWAAVKRHPSYGVEILDRIAEVPAVTREIVFSHHERLDGSGYPQGLSGAELSLPVRIAGLVDVFCSLISTRPYREAYTTFEALEILTSDLDRLFDRKLFAVFVKTLGV